MTITYVAGNILNDPGAIVVPVNTVGVMGAGMARAIALRAPDVERAYKSAYRLNMLGIGKILPIYAETRTYLMFPTKAHWQDPSQLDYIKQGLFALRSAVQKRCVQRIAIPRLGCGLGGLKWERVQPLIHQTAEILSTSGMDVVIYEVYMNQPTIVRVPPNERRVF